MGETITLEISLRAFVRRATRSRWIAVCPSLGVASQGPDEQAAKRSLDEAVQLWFESCIERGVLDQALKEAHFLPLPPEKAPPAGADLVRANRKVEPDILGDEFNIIAAIPAYQAARFVNAPA